MAGNDNSSRQITRRSHYVPRSYLKRWTRDDGTLAAYRLLVEHERVAEWRRCTPSGIGYHDHLYTYGRESALSDEIEGWLSKEYEDPAEPIISKAINGDRLSQEDWTILIRFVACQDLRTPSRMLAFLKRQEAQLPELMNEVLASAKAEMENADAEGRPLRKVAPDDPDFSVVPSKLTVTPGPDDETATLKYEAIVGRQFWLWSIRHQLNSMVQVLYRHRWTILRSPVGMTWLTSDNPVIRLAYASPTEYHLNGGWGRDKCEVLMPLGPEHIIYTMIGKQRSTPRGTRCAPWLADAIQRFTIENAHRIVFSVEPNDSVRGIRPRVVNFDAARHEAKEWQEWHERQLSAERDMFSA